MTPSLPSRLAPTPIPHRGWRLARAELLERASAGPGTVALLGEAGAGKSWLLRDLHGVLRRHGRAATLVRQGDLPWQLTPGTVLLIDEASRLNPLALAELAAQTTTVVILADLPSFADTLTRQARRPTIVRLPPLESAEVADFVATWLLAGGKPVDAVTPEGIARLAILSGGTPRLITLLLNAALAFADDPARISDATLDEVAALRWGDVQPRAVEARPVEAAVAPLVARPRARWIAAMAAGFVLAVLPHPLAQATRVAAILPPWVLVSSAPIVVANGAAPDLVGARPPPRAPSPAPTLFRPIAESPYPAASPPDVLEGAAIPDAPADTIEPGLILVARRGDTLRELYASLYRGVDAPPFETVAAANPKPVAPGTVIVFPPPTGGWPRR